MAHQIDTTSIGRASYASTQREWHGLGELMPVGASVEEWAVAAGMQYEVKRGYIRYATERLTEDAPISSLAKTEEKVVLFRNDTGNALGIVSTNYKVVQPRDVLALFKEWAAAGGVTIESAGVLFGGKRYFATAKLSEAACLDGTGDKIVLYALFSTSADGSLANEVRLVTVRVVCNNTLSMALGTAPAYRVTHRSTFKPEEAKKAIEDAHTGFGAFMTTARTLAGIQVQRKLAEEMTLALFRKGEADADKVRESRGFTKVIELFSGAAKGATLETARNTAWGWLNAVTEYADHHVRAQSEENRTASALWGQGDALKNKAVEIALAA